MIIIKSLIYHIHHIQGRTQEKIYVVSKSERSEQYSHEASITRSRRPWKLSNFCVRSGRYRMMKIAFRIHAPLPINTITQLSLPGYRRSEGPARVERILYCIVYFIERFQIHNLKALETYIYK